MAKYSFCDLADDFEQPAHASATPFAIERLMEQWRNPEGRRDLRKAALQTQGLHIPPELVSTYLTLHEVVCDAAERHAARLSAQGRTESANTLFVYVELYRGLLWELRALRDKA